jgi:SRSO17 transposase
MKDDIGLDHFEGRSWAGWHHHVTLTMIAFDFLVLEGFRSKKKLLGGLSGEPSERCNECF